MEWKTLKSTAGITFEEFSLLGEDLSTRGIITDAEIIDSVDQNDKEEDILINELSTSITATTKQEKQ